MKKRVRYSERIRQVGTNLFEKHFPTDHNVNSLRG